MDKITKNHLDLFKQGFLPVHAKYWAHKDHKIPSKVSSLKHNSDNYWLFPFYKPIANFVNDQTKKSVPGI